MTEREGTWIPDDVMGVAVALSGRPWLRDRIVLNVRFARVRRPSLPHVEHAQALGQGLSIADAVEAKLARGSAHRGGGELLHDDVDMRRRSPSAWFWAHRMPEPESAQWFDAMPRVKVNRGVATWVNSHAGDLYVRTEPFGAGFHEAHADVRLPPAIAFERYEAVADFALWLESGAQLPDVRLGRRWFGPRDGVVARGNFHV